MRRLGALDNRAMDLDLDKAASRLKKEQKARIDKERQKRVLS